VNTRIIFVLDATSGDIKTVEATLKMAGFGMQPVAGEQGVYDVTQQGKPVQLSGPCRGALAYLTYIETINEVGG